MALFFRFLCLAGFLSAGLTDCTITEDEEPRKTFPTRRAIDGTRGRKYYDPEEDNPYDNYGPSSGRYDSYEDETDLSDIRNNVPGEPGVDYPAYTRLPQTEFVCEDHFRGYYADEGAGCQVFHVCDGSFLVSSFLCPIGSIFSQKLLTCDWWNKVDCSSTGSYHAINVESHVSEVDEDEVLRKAFEMARVQSAGERIPVETVASQQRQEARHEVAEHRTASNYGGSITERINDLRVGQESYSDYFDYPTRFASRPKAAFGEKNRHRDDDYRPNVGNPSIKVHAVGQDRKNDRSGSFRNEFQPSYAPTVPTVVTTARKFYSPTIPTTPRPSTTRDAYGRYDLEFESSDHLYTARGRSEETVKAATPSPRPVKEEVKSATLSLPIVINGAAEIQRSEASRRISSPIHEPRSDANESSNDAISSSSDLEETVRGNLPDRQDRNTEKLSIRTIDNENRDPTVFSYDHDNDTNPGGEKIAEDAIDFGPSDDSDNADDGPAEFLKPPAENQSIFRITVLDETSTWNDQRSSGSPASSETDRNRTEKIGALEAPATVITPPLLGDKNDLLESRIIRIVFNNSASRTDFPKKISEPNISVENAESTDLSTERFFDASNATEEKTNSAGVDEEVASSINNGTFDSAKSADFIPPPTTTTDSNFVIEETKISTLEDSIGRMATSQDSTSSKISTAEFVTPTARLPDQSVDSAKSVYSEDIPLPNATSIGDTIELGSAPLQVTLSIDKTEEIDPSGEEIRKLLADQGIGDSIGAGDFKSFEIVRSNEPRDDRNFDRQPTSSKNDESTLGNFRPNELQSMNYLRGIFDFINGPNSPRPFSFGQPNVFEVKTPSGENAESVSEAGPKFVSQAPKNVILSEAARAPIRTSESIGSSAEDPNAEKSLETLEVSSSAFAGDVDNDRPRFRQRSKTDEEETIFELPGRQRFLNFETGLPLGVSEESASRIDGATGDRESNETNEDAGKVRTETEFIPSLGFSLNTEEEREKYMEAVVKGLLEGVTASDKTSNETDASLESEIDSQRRK